MDVVYNNEELTQRIIELFLHKVDKNNGQTLTDYNFTASLKKKVDDSITSKQLNELLNNYIPKINGKTLTSNDFSDSDKHRLYNELMTVEEFRLSILEATFLVKWMPEVPTFNDITSTYPTPQIGWGVKVLDTGNYYRWNGTTWELMDPSNIPTTQVLNETGNSTTATMSQAIITELLSKKFTMPGEMDPAFNNPNYAVMADNSFLHKDELKGDKGDITVIEANISDDGDLEIYGIDGPNSPIDFELDNDGNLVIELN